jgi:hypothetical protein
MKVMRKLIASIIVHSAVHLIVHLAGHLTVHLIVHLAGHLTVHLAVFRVDFAGVDEIISVMTFF